VLTTSESWYSIHELHKLKLEELPGSQKGIRDRVQRENWPTREVPGRGGPGGKRVEYQPPPELQHLINEIDIQRKQYHEPQSSEPLRAASPEPDDLYVYLPLYDVRAAAGAGALSEDGPAVNRLAFPRDWLEQQFGRSRVAKLCLIYVHGSSMEPTLSDSDVIMIDRSDREQLTEGIYVFMMGGFLFVKRLALDKGALRITEEGKQPHEQAMTMKDLREHADSFRIIGRVVWAGRKL